ncbi:Haloacetate dehalogenase H-2 [Paramyrothecium foliicola]|nr:Haloacetate dehalogenase H-2 [Paramyrothecium foliicola]
MSSNNHDEAGWQPKAIVFDLLTALLDSWSLWDFSTPTKSASEGRPWRERYLEITFGAGSYIPYADLVTQAAVDVGLPVSAAERLLADYALIEPWPEAAEVLKELKSHGYKLGVVTNCSRELGHLAIDKLNVQSLFDAAITAEESGYYKPVPQAYAAVLRLLDVEAKDVLFVAGSAGDVKGASEAGMKVVWHNRAGLARKGDTIPIREGKRLDDVLQGYL